MKEWIVIAILGFITTVAVVVSLTNTKTITVEKLISPCDNVENTLKEYCMAKEACKGNLKSFVRSGWGDVKFECGK